jgi:type IV pilus assembly protein PilW
MKIPRTDRTLRRQKGVTLVELMVALLLGMLLTAGMIQVFASNRVTYEFNQGLSRIQENARFALDHIAYTTRMAGYRGCLSDVAFHNNLAIPSPFRDDIENGLQGHNANGTATGQTFAPVAVDPVPSANPADWTPALPAELNNRVIPGSDVLVVRSVGGDAHPLVTPFSDSAQLFVAGPHDFFLGEILVVTDCQKASIFQVTNSTTVGFGVNLVHSSAGSYTPGNSSPTWGPEQSYGLGSEVARLNTYAFYVGRGASGRPTLFQLRLQLIGAGAAGFAPEELIEGVDTMQVRYGVDTDNDGAIDNWQTADGVADWTQVLSAEVTLLARATDEYGSEIDTATYNLGGVQFNPVDDRRLRQVFSTTIGVRNRLP